MLINKRTKWRDIAPLINKTNFDTILERTPERATKKAVLDLTIGEFIGLLENDSHIARKVVGSPKRALKMLGRLKSLKRQMAEIEQFLKANDYPQDSLTQRAAAGVQWPTPQERMLLDTQQRYGLKSLNEAEKAPLTDYLLMVRDTTSRAKFENNLNQLQKRKYSKKS